MKIPPRPPLAKGGWRGFKSYFLTKPESSYFKYLKILWTPVSTGVTTSYEVIKDGIMEDWNVGRMGKDGKEQKKGRLE